MAKKRSKPIAEHIETTTPEPVTTTPEPEPAPAPEQTLTHAEREEQRRPHGEPKNGVTRNQSDANPYPHYLVSLSNEKDAPTMRLCRERPSRQHGIREHAAAIEFSEQPPVAIRQKLSTSGWEYKAREKVWWKSLEPNVNAEDYKAQKLFESIVNELRAANGCEPIHTVGNGVS